MESKLPDRVTLICTQMESLECTECKSASSLPHGRAMCVGRFLAMQGPEAAAL